MTRFEDEIMNKIKKENIKPKSKNYFLLTKALFELALTSLFIAVIFVVNLSFYLPRRGMGMMRSDAGRFDLILSSIPWHYVVIGILGISLIIWMVYHYTGAYKTRIMVVIGIVSLFVLITGFLLSLSQVNERILEHRREFKRFYNQEEMPRPFMPIENRGRLRN